VCVCRPTSRRREKNAGREVSQRGKSSNKRGRNQRDANPCPGTKQARYHPTSGLGLSPASEKTILGGRHTAARRGSYKKSKKRLLKKKSTVNEKVYHVRWPNLGKGKRGSRSGGGKEREKRKKGYQGLRGNLHVGGGEPFGGKAYGRGGGERDVASLYKTSGERGGHAEGICRQGVKKTTRRRDGWKEQLEGGRQGPWERRCALVLRT